MSQMEKNAKIRNTVLDFVTGQLSKNYDADVLRVSASEVTMPWVDDEGNEMWVLVKVSIPRGSRTGDGGYDAYDGYSAAEDYEAEQKEKAEKKEASKAKKEAKIARDAKRRAEKAALAEANKNLKELRKIKTTPQE